MSPSRSIGERIIPRDIWTLRPPAVPALAIDEKALGPDHPDVATIAEVLAADLRKLGRDTEAKVYEDQAANDCARTVHESLVFISLRLASSEKQVPQIIENIRNQNKERND